MNVLIDLNIVLDVLLIREPWVADSKGVWDANHEKRIRGYLAATEFVPGNREIVHHVLTYLDTRGNAERLDRAVWSESRAASREGAVVPATPEREASPAAPS